MTRGLMSANSDGMAPSFLSANLGKRSLALDLKNPDAREIIHKLVAQADVVVENFKPGTIERLGYGYEALRAIKPDLCMPRFRLWSDRSTQVCPPLTAPSRPIPA